MARSGQNREPMFFIEGDGEDPLPAFGLGERSAKSLTDLLIRLLRLTQINMTRIGIAIFSKCQLVA
jgi:hypothetical protein